MHQIANNIHFQHSRENCQSQPKSAVDIQIEVNQNSSNHNSATLNFEEPQYINNYTTIYETPNLNLLNNYNEINSFFNERNRTLPSDEFQMDSPFRNASLSDHTLLASSSSFITQNSINENYNNIASPVQSSSSSSLLSNSPTLINPEKDGHSSNFNASSSTMNLELSTNSNSAGFSTPIISSPDSIPQVPLFFSLPYINEKVVDRNDGTPANSIKPLSVADEMVVQNPTNSGAKLPVSSINFDRNDNKSIDGGETITKTENCLSKYNSFFGQTAIKFKSMDSFESMMKKWSTLETESDRKIVKIDIEYDKKIFLTCSTIQYPYNTGHDEDDDDSLSTECNSNHDDYKVVSCIYLKELDDYFITSPDLIHLFEKIIKKTISFENKNRMRRVLEVFKPITIKKKPEGNSNFNTIMKLNFPKPRKVEKDIKIYADYAMKNPFYQLEMPIVRADLFDAALNKLVKQININQ
ncbi:hypothetical protein HK099_001508 [Clydaea vesicula]|uniref:DUF7082 domain-containing protein n=1 Tax=Clydaea vesicula TaxID=447962 RepID=A0AAD5U6S6_9FUNG|nr:hypothetical protein HK099_001508 [Clydaea vesicula]